jgi:hypothetical protein
VHQLLQSPGQKAVDATSGGGPEGGGRKGMERIAGKVGVLALRWAAFRCSEVSVVAAMQDTNTYGCVVLVASESDQVVAGN